MASDTITIGPYVVGEIQSPLQYTFLESDGSPMNLTGYTAKFVTRPVDDESAVATYAASVSAPLAGEVTYAWTGAEILTPGRHWAQIWVGNTTNRFASLRMDYSVQASVGPVPSI